MSYQEHANEEREQVRGPFSWIEVALGGLSAALLATTIVSPDWIERVFAIEPDGGDGSAEWGWVVALAAVTLACFLDAGRTRWQTARVPPISK